MRPALNGRMPLVWFVTIVLILIAVVLLILFLNRYYRKATREVALVSWLLSRSSCSRALRSFIR